MRFLLIAFFWALPVHARVLDVHSEIRIAKSGELIVTERVTLETAKKGGELERELPQAARVVEVIRNGHPEAYILDGLRLRLGGPGLPQGRHLYQITYRCERCIAFLPEHDALRWSLKGGERHTAEVILPSSVPARQIKVAASGGDFQSGASHQSFVRDGRAAFRSQGPLAVVVRFPKGVVTEPGVDERTRWFLSDYFGVLLVVAMLALSAWVLLQLTKLSARS